MARRPCRRLHGYRVLLVFLFLCHVASPPQVATLGAVTVIPRLWKQILVPGLPIVVGLGLHALGVSGWLPIFMVYFGAHTGMNFYMKYVLSEFHVDEELKGLPMALLVTSIQQFVVPLGYAIFFLFGHMAGKDYTLKRLRTWREVWMVIVFGLAFAGNIGLNNFSLSLLTVSLNLIIRSCLPLATAVVEILVRGRKACMTSLQWMCLFFGVSAAFVASYCKINRVDEGEAADFSRGLCAAIFSLIAAALQMVLAGVLGTDLDLKSVECACYMALPAGMTMLLPAVSTKHQVTGWPPEFQQMTDWQILQEVFERNSGALVPVLCSGVVAFLYNVLQYTVVRKLSPTTASFAGNFSTATGIVLCLALGLEGLPEGHGGLFVLAILFNILAFTAFTALKA